MSGLRELWQLLRKFEFADDFIDVRIHVPRQRPLRLILPRLPARPVPQLIFGPLCRTFLVSWFQGLMLSAELLGFGAEGLRG